MGIRADHFSYSPFEEQRLFLILNQTI
jgi:hypothetical protein